MEIPVVNFNRLYYAFRSFHFSCLFMNPRTSTHALRVLSLSKYLNSSQFSIPTTIRIITINSRLTSLLSRKKVATAITCRRGKYRPPWSISATNLRSQNSLHLPFPTPFARGIVLRISHLDITMLRLTANATAVASPLARAESVALRHATRAVSVAAVGRSTVARTTPQFSQAIKPRSIARLPRVMGWEMRGLATSVERKASDKIYSSAAEAVADIKSGQKLLVGGFGYLFTAVRIRLRALC